MRVHDEDVPYLLGQVTQYRAVPAARPRTRVPRVVLVLAPEGRVVERYAAPARDDGPYPATPGVPRRDRESPARAGGYDNRAPRPYPLYRLPLEFLELIFVPPLPPPLLSKHVTPNSCTVMCGSKHTLRFPPRNSSES